MSKKKNKKVQVRRAIRLNGIDTDELELAKVASVSLKHTDKSFIYFDKLPSGKWQLVYTDNVIEDISKLISMEIIRDG